MAELFLFVYLSAMTRLPSPVLAGDTVYASVIDIDLTPFFDSLNQYLPTFIGIFALIGGIGGAIIFSKYIIGTILDVFGGKGI